MIKIQFSDEIGPVRIVVENAQELQEAWRVVGLARLDIQRKREHEAQGKRVFGRYLDRFLATVYEKTRRVKPPRSRRMTFWQWLEHCQKGYYRVVNDARASFYCIRENHRAHRAYQEEIHELGPF